MAIIRSSRWITDSITVSVQCLLKKQTGENIFGWQSPQLSKRKAMFKPLAPKVPFIQVLHVNNNHWITASNIKPNSDTVYPDTVCLYDSNWSEKSSIILTTKQHVCSFYKSEASEIRFNFVNVEIGSGMVLTVVFMHLPLLLSWHMVEILPFTFGTWIT